MSVVDPSTHFQVFAHMRAFVKSDDNGKPQMWIGGIASTDDLDQQDEIVVTDGLDFKSVFLARGWFNDNHKQGTTDVLGYPQNAFMVKPGDILPDGSVSEVTGWWVDGWLLDTKKGREVHELCHALQGTPRQLGFSIEGKVTQRKSKTVKGAVVHNVAITHCPVQTKSYMVALAKAMTAGNAVASGDMNQGPGDGSALRTESLDGGDNPTVADDELTDEDKRKAMAANLEGATAFPEHVIGKSDGASPVRVTDQSEIERWAPALLAHPPQADQQPTMMTKSEADIVARVLYPHVDADTRRTLINTLTTPTGGI